MNIGSMPLIGAEIAQRTLYFSNSCSFPLRFNPSESYKTGGRKFGAKRPVMGEGVLHPACDLIAPIGTEVLAVDDGIIVRGPYKFYLGSYAIEVQHKFFIVRYGELKYEKLTTHIVKRGDVIGKVGKVGKGSMLHLEMFSGRATGDLTQKPFLPYNRRKDLIDPTPFLDMWAIGVPIK